MLSTLIVNVLISDDSSQSANEELYQQLRNILVYAPPSVSHFELEFDCGVNRFRSEEYMLHSEWEHLDDLLSSRAGLFGVTIRFIDSIPWYATEAPETYNRVIKTIKDQIPKLMSRKDLVSFGECNKLPFSCSLNDTCCTGRDCAQEKLECEGSASGILVGLACRG